MAGVMEPTREPGAGRAAPDLDAVRAAFPQFEILGLIGQGGMGAVYKARQPQLDRFVALKILTPPPGADQHFAERFQREARALARLSHPHIVTVHDFGQAGVFFYLLMEFVDGVNLRQAMKAGRFTPSQALAVVPPICEALQYAHDRGIVHRDIKPENLLLDKAGRLKIADFGIALMMGAAPESPAGAFADRAAAGLTQGSVLGTPQYMAPEQSAPSSSQVDHRADIYSLGVVLYELLTGELPSSKLEAPSSHMRGIQVDVRLDEIVLRALQEQPERRYRTALDFKTDVEIVAATPVPHAVPPAASRVGPSSSSGNAPRRIPSARAWMIGACVFLLLPVVFIVALVFAPNRYFAKVTIEVRADAPESANSFAGAGRSYDPQFVTTQFQILQKSEILYPVIERLNLVKEFSPPEHPLTVQQVYLRLKKSMQLQAVRNTGLIEIGIYDTDPQRAANIANTIAVVYKEMRRADILENRRRELEPVQDEVEKQRKIVEEMAARAAELRAIGGIADPDPESPNSVLGTSPDKEAVSRYLEAKGRYLQSRRFLEAAELTLSEQRMRLSAADGRESVKIWEHAEPATYSSSAGLRGLLFLFDR